MFLITRASIERERRGIAAGWIVAALAGLLLGLVQISQPDGGWAYPYRSHQPGLAGRLVRQPQP